MIVLFRKHLIVFLLMLPFWGLSQDFENYQPLRSQGQIPQELIISSTEKYNEAKRNIEAGTGFKNKKRQKDFFLQSNFVLDELLSSGTVLFNDPINEYVKKVADVILKDQPELRKELTFYTIKSSRVNAFATDRGEIFVNVGLIAHVENEAQLAFILCHEIQHYVKRHNLNTFIEFDKIKQGAGVYKRQKSYEKIVSKHSYSQSLETEADNLGIELFLKTKYAIAEIDGVFEILALTHVPYANDVFDYSYLEVGDIQFDDALKLETTNAIRKIYGEDEEELSTHPSVKSRLENLQEKLKGETNTGRFPFVVSEKEFQTVKKIAQFDICNILVESRSYAAAIYHSFLLSEEYPNNQYLDVIVAKSLYGLAQYKNGDKFREIPTRSDSIQGEMQKVFHLFDKMHKEDLNTLAGRYMFELRSKYSGDKWLDVATRDMVEDIVIYGIEDDPDDYFVNEKPSQVEKDTTAEGEESASEEPLFAKYAFAGMLDNEDLKEMFKDGKKYKKDFEERDSENRRSRGRNKNGEALGIDNAIFVNPIYIKIDDRKKNEMQFVLSEQRQMKFKSWISENAEKLDMKANILDFNHLEDGMTADEYNEIIAINNWVSEYLDHEMYMFCSNHNEILPIKEKYGTGKFVYTGVYTYRGAKNSTNQLYNLLYFYFPVTAPIGVYTLFKPKTGSAYFTVVFDFEKSKTLMRDVNIMETIDKDAVIRSNLYWSMLQMKRKKK